SFDPQNFPIALHIDIPSWGDILQLLRRCSFAWHIPHSPQRPVFRPQSPEREGLDSKKLGCAHFVESSHRVEKPDFMLAIVLVEITDMRVQSVAIEIHVGFRVTRCEPSVLCRNV